MKQYLKKNPDVYLWIAVFIMVILFWSSSKTYQEQTSVPFLEKALKSQPAIGAFSNIRFQYADSEVSIAHLGYFKFIEFFIRKAAHFFTYFLMGGSWFLGLHPKIKNMGWSALVGWLAATGYAGLDEFHQMLTGGRSPLFQDVMLDSAGALTAVILCILLIAFRRFRKGK